MPLKALSVSPRRGLAEQAPVRVPVWALERALVPVLEQALARAQVQVPVPVPRRLTPVRQALLLPQEHR
ncbi:MAG: hypothetical protein Q8O16_02565 [Dehalococcoidia bacterium]|nr:hypothetical protein [Dehalococcoidia bacterium]